MKNEYHKDIVDLLLETGREGMNVREIARRVYNQHYGLFAHDVVYETIYNQVRGYLWSQARQRRSPFTHLRWGWYAIKPDYAIQLDFIIDLYRDELENENTEQTEEPDTRQLSLFEA